MKKSIWTLILLILSIAAFSQYRDAGLWASLSARYEPGKKWKLSIEEEARFYQNMSRLDKLNTEFSVDYQISKSISAGILYRFISNQHSSGTFDFNHRIAASLGVEKKRSGWSCSLKTSFQKTYPEIQHSREWDIPENYVRALAEVSKELKKKKNEPYSNIEFWYRVQAGQQGFIDQYRFTIGIKRKINKANKVSVFYRLQQELQVKNPLTAHIIGIGYGFVVHP